MERLAAISFLATLLCSMGVRVAERIANEPEGVCGADVPRSMLPGRAGSLTGIHDNLTRPACDCCPPSEREGMCRLPSLTKVPGFLEESRDDCRLVVEKIKDSIQSPRVYPLVGRAQLHKCHYKCSVYYVQTIDLQYPFPCRSQRHLVHVVYIDKDHLHVCGKGEFGSECLVKP